MGTSWSEEANNSSHQQENKPEVHPESEAGTSLRSGNIVHHSTNANNNNSTYKPKEANKAPFISNAQANKVPVSNNYNKPNEANKVLPKLPHNFEAIIKDSGPIDNSSVGKIYEQLYAGVYLEGKKKKYWVEKKGNSNCFAVFANGLSITWGENPQYWNLHNEDTSDHGDVTIAQLLNVCWLEVHGKLDTAKLTPGVTYQVTYVIKLEQTAYGWEVPVNFSLTLPDGTKRVRTEYLTKKPKGEWIPIPVGEFTACQEKMGEVEFSLYEFEGGNWKKGLVIKGVTIEPKINVSS